MDLNTGLKNDIGFGSAPLGNMFKDISDKESEATLQSVWDNGIRYFDTAPQYGAGLSELRLGKFLSQYDRNDFVLSSKVGRYISNETEVKEGLFSHARKNKVITDYSESGTLLSLEQSLKRLNTDHLDIVFVHDISPDYYGDNWITHFDEARKGAFKVLSRLKDEGVIKHWGIGVNRTEPIELLMKLEEYKPDICLSATQYTLLQHENALHHMMDQAMQHNIQFIIGGAYSSGALLNGDYYNYEKITDEKREYIKQLEAIAVNHHVTLKAAALQFSKAHPATKAIIPGSTKPDRIKEDILATQESIPEAFWKELTEKGFISSYAPLPKS
ncbi:aldo/keto reductase [Oceanobacillus jeddahense]|uniref:aldo/keto reductase n=1 Tax=Oceanobacillus jeddahense TaxID=1462527 RepID=UPI0005961E44|nr:aldo/keto reductase [Oceanobacillus jeddahense]